MTETKTKTPEQTPPSLNINLFSVSSLECPYENYKTIRDTAPVTYLSPDGIYALGRYTNVRQALTDWEKFSSSEGVALNDGMNFALKGTTLGSNPPEHGRLRSVLTRPLMPQSINQLRERMQGLAAELINNLAKKGQFDAVPDLARHLPLTVVSELVGLPEEGRQRMLDWAAAGFNCMGPSGNERVENGFPTIMEMGKYVSDPSLPDRLRPGSWSATLYEAVKSGELVEKEFQSVIAGYLTPSLDTTIFAISNMIKLFAENPEQWAKLRAEPALAARAINEALRIESPLQYFSRLTTEEVNVDGFVIPANSRVLMMFASANRDERKFQNPETFDITRASTGGGGHLAFGTAHHMCAGRNLALLEMRVLLDEMIKQFTSIRLISEKRVINNMLRGYQNIVIEVDPAN
ncbi:MAG: cytochrome [Robiginitomaculum sp.]|nr:MAG: cytochrome [Robiginitomaculum sp.]